MISFLQQNRSMFFFHNNKKRWKSTEDKFPIHSNRLFRIIKQISTYPTWGRIKTFGCIRETLLLLSQKIRASVTWRSWVNCSVIKSGKNSLSFVFVQLFRCHDEKKKKIAKLMSERIGLSIIFHHCKRCMIEQLDRRSDSPDVNGCGWLAES